MNRTTALLIAALSAALILPTEVSAQKNINQSRKQGSVISGGTANLIFPTRERQ